VAFLSADLLARKYAKKYSSLEDFKIRSPDVFLAAEIAGLLDKVAHYIEQRSVKTPIPVQKNKVNPLPPRKERQPRVSKWTHEKVKAEALKYQKKIDFKTAANGAVHYAVKHGIYDEITSHMHSHGNVKWTHELVFEEAKKYSLREHFKLKSTGAYHYAKRNSLLNEICSHMKPLESPPVLEKSSSLQTKNRRIVWTHELVREEAKKYSSKEQFRIVVPGAYRYAQRHDLLDTILIHTKRGKWSYESALKEALKYQKRTQFKTGCRGAHSYAVKHGILDEICKHMAPPQKNGRERPANKVSDESTSL